MPTVAATKSWQIHESKFHKPSLFSLSLQTIVGSWMVHVSYHSLTLASFLGLSTQLFVACSAEKLGGEAWENCLSVNDLIPNSVI